MIDYETKTLRLFHINGMRLIRNYKRSYVFSDRSNVKVTVPKRRNGARHIYNQSLKAAGIQFRFGA